MKIELDPKTLAPLIEQVVAETLRQVDEDRARLGDRLAYPEAEAAALLGVGRHVLRDARLRGAIEASTVGKRIVYTRSALESFLQRNRWG